MGHSTQWVFDSAYEKAPMLPIFDLKEDALYDLAWVIAPVFNAGRNVAFVIGVQGFSGK